MTFLPVRPGWIRRGEDALDTHCRFSACWSERLNPRIVFESARISSVSKSP